MPSKAQSILLGTAAYVGVSLLIQLLGRGAGFDQPVVFGVVGCLLMLALGAIPAWHYTNANRLSIPAGAGAGMGAAAIAIGALLLALVTWVAVEAGMAPDPRTVAAEEAERRGLSPEEVEALTLVAHPLLMGLVGTVIGAVVGAVGGAIGASVFRRGDDGPPRGYDRGA